MFFLAEFSLLLLKLLCLVPLGDTSEIKQSINAKINSGILVFIYSGKKLAGLYVVVVYLVTIIATRDGWMKYQIKETSCSV